MNKYKYNTMSIIKVYNNLIIYYIIIDIYNIYQNCQLLIINKLRIITLIIIVNMNNINHIVYYMIIELK